MYVDGLFSTITSGLSKASSFVVSASNPILQARQQYELAKNLWNNPAGTPPAAGAPAPVSAPAVRQLSNGAEVRELQQRLKNIGIDPGPIDGLYGDKTAAGIRTYQARIGMAQDGRATSAVLSLLRTPPPPLRNGAPAPSPRRLPPMAPAPQVAVPRTSGASASLRNGAQVRELQTHLQTMGINPGPIDGVYGQKTAAGIRQFQGLAGLPQDGRATVSLLTIARTMAPVIAGKGPGRAPAPRPSPAPAPAPAARAPSADGTMSPWVVPVAAAGAGLLLMGVMVRRRR